MTLALLGVQDLHTPALESIALPADDPGAGSPHGSWQSAMHPGTWFGKLWTRIQREVVADVPPSLEECESCRETDCTQERWLTCARRLAAEAESLGSPSAVFPSITGRTDEMPGISSTGMSSVSMVAQDDEPNEEPMVQEPRPRRRRLSSAGE